MIVKDFKSILLNFRFIVYQLLFYQGRYIWTIVAVVFVFWGIIKKRYDKDEFYLI